MKKKKKKKKGSTFDLIIQKGNKSFSKSFIIYSIETEEKNPLFGIAVSKKIGNAVTRNKLKRKYRNIIDNNRNLFKNNRNYIIMIRKESLTNSFNDINEEMKTLLEKGEI